MQQTRFKQVITQRGFKYAYYFAAAVPGKPTILFSHGFPTPAFVWRSQVAFFEALGFGIVAPDLLGYGSTDKPSDPTSYVGSGMAQDVVDVLDAEKVEKVVAVGHDWGSLIVSRLANYHPERLLGCVFFDIGYIPPAPYFRQKLVEVQESIGYDNLAYQRYFVEPEAHVLIEKNFDSFFSLIFPVDTATENIWREHMCEPGKTKAWIEANRTSELPPYMSPADKEEYRQALLGGGFCAPLCWYKVFVDKSSAEDDAKVPKSAVTLNQPILFVAFSKDPIGLPLFGTTMHEAYVKPDSNVTYKEVEADHWAVLSHAGELNKMLLEWIEELRI